ncbi:hypothetical protein CGRA01v4_07342 [Colletotrichum graminicola]|nr:hypothetical protein CGRA01v4_07342 [Colletotrichum graminicola]
MCVTAGWLPGSRRDVATTDLHVGLLCVVWFRCSPCRHPPYWTDPLSFAAHITSSECLCASQSLVSTVSLREPEGGPMLDSCRCDHDGGVQWSRHVDWFVALSCMSVVFKINIAIRSILPYLLPT